MRTVCLLLALKNGLSCCAAAELYMEMLQVLCSFAFRFLSAIHCKLEKNVKDFVCSSRRGNDLLYYFLSVSEGTFSVYAKEIVIAKLFCLCISFFSNQSTF